MTSKAERRRRRRMIAEAVITLPGSDPVPQRRTGPGRPRKTQEDARLQMLRARCAIMGWPTTADTVREVAAPWYGCNAGRAVATHASRADHPALWDAIVWMRRAVAAYDAAIGAPRRHAVCLSLLAPPETTEASADSPPPDLRSDTERHNQAVAAWMRLHGIMGSHDAATASMALRCVIDDEPARDPAGLLKVLRGVMDG